MMPEKKVAGKKTVAPKGRARATRGGSLTIRAVGPAAESFGREIAPLGERGGILATRVGHLILDAADFGVRRIEKVADYLRKSVSEKLKELPEEKIVEPNPRIAIPTMEALVYSSKEEHIRDMFTNLLASDMNSDKKDGVHPAFVGFIKEMTSNDAKCLHAFTGTGEQIEFRPELRLDSRVVDIGHQAFSFQIEGCSVHDISRSLNNLERLGIIQRRINEYTTTINIAGIETRIEKSCGDFLERIQTDHEYRAQLGIIDPPEFEIAKFGLYRTVLGGEFISACLSNSGVTKGRFLRRVLGQKKAAR
jgi:hypothetical protein